ncbi:hypothetical protein ACIRP0_36860 [Streptomyces sp. NPDC101733]|uniref:hypothetical protein n=1 Tax=unclassified Streptomyces TaxID=2593676 RepID=UPI0038170C42
MPLWLTLLTILAGWTLTATTLGLLLARHIHRTPQPTPAHHPRTALAAASPSPRLWNQPTAPLTTDAAA